MQPASPTGSTSTIRSQLRLLDENIAALPRRIHEQLVALGFSASEIDDESRPVSRAGSITQLQPQPSASEAHPSQVEKRLLTEHVERAGTTAEFAELEAMSQARVSALRPDLITTTTPQSPKSESPKSPFLFQDDSAVQSTNGTQLDILPELQPRISKAALSRIKNGQYHPTADDAAAHDHFMSQRSCLHFLDQEDRRVALILYTSDEQTCFKPNLVMTDTGGDLYTCVSQHWAEHVV